MWLISLFFDWLLRDDSCPIELEDKEWLESRWAALAKFLPDPRDATVALLVTEFFPEPYQGRLEDLWPLLDRICKLVGVESRRFVFSYGISSDPPRFEPVLRPKAPPPTDPHEITMMDFELRDPVVVAAIVAKHACRALVPDDEEEEPDEVDSSKSSFLFPRKTGDLVCIYRGMGVLLANATLRESTYQMGAMVTVHHCHNPADLDQRTLAYALALFARARGEKEPTWAEHLTGFVRTMFWQAMRFLAGPAPEADRRAAATP